MCVCVRERLAGTVVCPHTQFHHLVCISHENVTMVMILFVEDLKVKCPSLPFCAFDPGLSLTLSLKNRRAILSLQSFILHLPVLMQR